MKATAFQKPCCSSSKAPVQQSLWQPVAETSVVTMAELERQESFRGKTEDRRDIYLLTVHRSKKEALQLEQRKKHDFFSSS